MNLAWVSLSALFLAIFVSCTTRLNVGILCLAFSWIIGVYLGGMKLDEVAQGFPVQLFLTLTGVTLLFTQAQVNGTLDKVAHRAVRLCRGNAGLVPVMFFLLAAALASMGPGNIATTALLAPMAMAIGGRAGVPAFLMAIMVGNGANAGSLSPFAPTGVIVNSLMANIGLAGLEWRTYANNFLAHFAVAFTGYLLLGGWSLFRLRREKGAASVLGVPAPDVHANPGSDRFDFRNWTTLGVIFSLIAGVIFFRVHVGMGAFAGAVVLALLRVAEHEESIRKMPWRVILMVSGVTVLIALLEKTQGMDLFADLLARFATPGSVTGVIAFVTGLISAYSSTSGVVLPAFLPTIPGLVERLGGADPIAIAFSMNVGSHLVDVSPLSTIGALCLAAAPATEDTRVLFNKLLAWGLSMTVVGGVACYIFFGWL